MIEWWEAGVAHAGSLGQPPHGTAAVDESAGRGLVVGVPTDVIDTVWFTRMTPVRWWRAESGRRS